MHVEKLKLKRSIPEKVLSVRNTKFSHQCVESPKFLSPQEYFPNPKPMFPSILELKLTTL